MIYYCPEFDLVFSTHIGDYSAICYEDKFGIGGKFFYFEDEFRFRNTFVGDIQDPSSLTKDQTEGFNKRWSQRAQNLTKISKDQLRELDLTLYSLNSVLEKINLSQKQNQPQTYTKTNQTEDEGQIF